MMANLRGISILLVLALGLGLGTGCGNNNGGDEGSESSGESASGEGSESTEGEGASGGTNAQLPAPDDVAAVPEGAERSDSGLAWRVLEAGEGDAHPDSWDEVEVHYTGWTTDGNMFDSSVQRGTPATFRLDRVIAGWTEGVQLMVAGEKRRFWIPENLAYGGRPGAPAGMLVFDVELISIRDREAPPAPIPAPDDVAAIPEDAERSESGLAWKVLQEGTGTEHPDPWDTATVHYTGWTTDGEMFDSSVQRGQPAPLELNRVIPGWTEGVPMMVVGEKRRFWIPEDLAYGGRPGAPPGMLVFEIELLDITDRPEPPATPDDVAEIPANAERSESGLAWRVLERGTGTEHPTENSVVEIEMNGWIAESGQLFDSTVVNGRNITLPLNTVNIQGWREGIPMMVVGEKRRFWIPENLAFRGTPRMPPGMIVCDITLVRVQNLAPPTPPPTEAGDMAGDMGTEAAAAAPTASPMGGAMIDWGAMAGMAAAPAATRDNE